MDMVLAVDCSTSENSVALVDDTGTLAAFCWQALKRQPDGLLAAIRQVMTGVAFESITAYAVGTGPGNFTGLRMATSTLQALALPSGTPVTGICSADAIAFALRRDHDGPVLIVGDARRDRLWTILSRDGDATHTETRVIPAVELVSMLADSPRLLVASPDWGPLEALLSRTVLPPATLVFNPVTPTAENVGRLALDRLRRGTEPLPADPIYVHPPVFIDPVFTESSKRPIQPSP